MQNIKKSIFYIEATGTLLKRPPSGRKVSWGRGDDNHTTELCVLTTELCVSCGRDYRARFVGLFVGGWVDRTLRVITPF